MRLAWYKLYYPLQYYAAYMTVRSEDLEMSTILRGRQAVKARMAEIKGMMDRKEAKAKEEGVFTSLQIVNEMMARGFEFLPIDIYKSTATNYIVEDGKIRLPFSAVAGCGDAVAKQLEEAKFKKKGEEIVKDENGNPVIDEFLSIEDAQLRSHAPQTLIDKLRDIGAFATLPSTTQLNLFDMM